MEDLSVAAPLSGYKDLLSVDDLAEIFGISKQTVYKEMGEGKFGNPIRIGRAYKIPKVYILGKYFTNHQCVCAKVPEHVIIPNRVNCCVGETLP